ncbi:hypothetical protein [Flavihumibacter fluvii]|uniref:hypothetical protein n=1 Tax=Flavihumibacter fluvii TaxID=2838157 RepID=UPI001BDF2D6B|nr:hypothetical protein [Flavihumibacter fluvii]ULQ52170.1 hypothetical protein KJS93_18935 [Flavihumibacter fluvii]
MNSSKFPLRKNFLHLAISFVLGVVFMLVLFIWTNNRLRQQNDFNRLFPPHFLANKINFDLGVNSYYFAGHTSTGLFLGNSTVPGFYNRINLNLADTQYIRANFFNKELYSKTDLTILVDSPIVYLFSPQQKEIWITMQDPGERKKLNINDIQSLNAITPISRNILAIKSFDSSSKQRMLAAISMDGAILSTYHPEKKGDGIFSTNGILLSNDYTIFYVYNHWNGITRLDSNLHVLYNRTTIDGISKPELNIINLKKEATLMLKGTSTPVNIGATMNAQYLFIHSGRQARNENVMAFNSAWVIDVYAIQTGYYQFSFYIPMDRDTKPSYFKVIGDYLFVLYGNYLIRYTMDQVKDHESQ